MDIHVLIYFSGKGTVVFVDYNYNCLFICLYNSLLILYHIKFYSGAYHTMLLSGYFTLK